MEHAEKPFPRGTMFMKLFLVLLLVTGSIFTGVLYASLDRSRAALLEQKSQDTSLFIERTGQYLDLYLQNIRYTLLSLSKTSVPALQAGDAGELERLLAESVEYHNSMIRQIYILSSAGQVYSSAPLLLDIIGNPELRRMFEIAKENPSLISWSRPYYSPLHVDNTVAFVLSIRDASGREAGTVLAEVDLSRLTSQLGELLYRQEQSFMLANDFGDLISVDRGSELIPMAYGPEGEIPENGFLERLLQLPNGISSVAGDDRSLMTVKSNRNQLGWYLFVLTDESIFEQHAHELVRTFISYGCICFILLIACSAVITRYVTKPIRLLALQMDRFQGERFSLPLQTMKRNDEIGYLSDRFRLMVERTQDLVESQKADEERKRKLELKLLLSQIRPHFLYNTLTCIGSLAKQHRTGEVEETIRALILLLTFSIDKKKEKVSLAEELASLEAYIQIQKVRYGDSFRFGIHVPFEHRSLLVPKLILQPIVENAIFHGLAARGEGEIIVQSHIADGRLQLSVRDDGAGISEDKLPLLLQPGNHGVKRSKGMNSMGLNNVHERIQLMFGSPFGLTIRSEPNVGTEVNLLLPSESEE